VVPPSPALVRNGSKQRKMPSVLTPGQLTPHPVQAYIPIAVNRANGQHPYAVAGIGAGYEYAQQNEQYKPQQAYDRISPMVPSVGVTPVAVSNVRAMGGETGVSQDYNGQDLGDAPNKPSFFKMLCPC
jgi:casein kinase 1